MRKMASRNGRNVDVVLEEFNGRHKGIAHGDNLKCAMGLLIWCLSHLVVGTVSHHL